MKHTNKLVRTNTLWILISLFFCSQLWSQDILIPFKKGKLYGYANEAGEMVIPPDFEDVQPFDKNGRAVVVKYGLFGQIDKSGKEVIPCIFPRQFNTDRLFVETESSEKKWLNLEKIWLPAFPKYFIRNRKDGTLLECSSRAKVSIFAFSDNLRGAVEGNFLLGMSSIILPDSTVNIIDTSGQFIFQKNYPNISIYSDKLFAIGNEEGHIALMNREEKLLTGYDFDRIYCPFDSPYLTLQLKDQGRTNTPLNKLMDRKGKMIFKNAYPGLDFVCGESFAYLPAGQQNWTILNLKEDSVGVLKFNETKYLGYFAAGTKNGQKFLLNKSLEIVDGPFKNLQYNRLLKSIIGQKNDSTYIYLQDNEEPKRFFGPGWTVIQGNIGTDELILYSNSFERRYYLLKSNGEFILADPFEKIHPLSINASYFVQDGFQKGVYDLKKGWVLPLQERYQCYYTGHPGKPNSFNVKYNEGYDEYLYTDNYEKVKTGKKYDFETSRSDAEDPAYHKFTSPKGEKFYFAKEYNAELNYAGEFPYFQVRQDRNIYFYKTDASPLIPDGYWATSNGEKMGNGKLAAFEVRNDNQIGVVNQEGNWIVGPLPLSKSGVYRTTMENNNFIVLQKADSDELYNLKGEKLSNPMQRKFTFYGKNLIGITEGPSRADTRMYLYTTQIEKVFPEAAKIISNHDEKNFIARLTDNKEAPLWVLDEQGKKYLELPYEDASFTEDVAGRMIVSQNRLQGVVDSNGKVLVTCDYKKIRQSHPFFLMETEDRLDILNLENKVKQTTLPIGVHYVTRDQTYASFRKNDQAYTLDYDGNLISTLQGNIRELKEGHPLRDICYQITGQGRGTIYVLKETGKVFWE